MASQPHPLLTFEEYVDLERRLDCKFEYCRGHVYAMSGASYAHVIVQSNLIRHLGNRLAETTCSAVGSDLRVYVEASDLYTYPDVSIVCGPAAMNRRMAATNPKVIFEILSPSSRVYDAVGKFGLYQRIATLEEYILAEQDSFLIERYRRLADGQWELTRYEGEDAVLELASVGITVPLREIYANVPFELAEREPERP